MTHSTDIPTLARWMAGDFSNQAQAYENPPFFAHIRVCMRPLPYELFGGVSLFLEQAYDFMLHNPYRLRVLNFVIVNGRIEIEHYTIEPEADFHGAARKPEMFDRVMLDFNPLVDDNKIQHPQPIGIMQIGRASCRERV